MFASDDGPVRAADAAHAAIGRAHLALLRAIAGIQRDAVWEADGAANVAHWVSMRYGISYWKAERWVRAAAALPGLPMISAALADGSIGIDKVVELTRFATAKTEAALVRWAPGVAAGGIRRRADLEARRAHEGTDAVQRDRSFFWWHTDEGRRLAFEGELPAAEGAIVVKAVERMAARVPVLPGEGPSSLLDGHPGVDARRADALVAICRAQVAADPDPDRATVVVHVSTSGPPVGELEDGGIVDAPTVARLLCDARIQTVIEDEGGRAIGLGRTAREPSPWMIRQVRRRDRECRFPGCGRRAFAEAHHIRWWSRGGRTDLDNLVLICSFHHRLVHEHGWGLAREPDGDVRWSRPDGTRYRSGPAHRTSLARTG